MTSMKFYSPDKTVLMEIASVKPHPNGVLIEGKIMGTMPMKAVLKPAEIRAGFRFLSPRLIWTLLTMLFRPNRQ
jgi:hypothetical protein